MDGGTVGQYGDIVLGGGIAPYYLDTVLCEDIKVILHYKGGTSGN